MKLAAKGEKAARIPVLAKDALAWATINGAKALMLDHKIGSLTPGKQADLLLLRGSDLNLFPVHDPVYAIEMAHAGNVDTVMIAGQVKKQAGKLLFDERVLRGKRDLLVESASRLMREAGYRAM